MVKKSVNTDILYLILLISLFLMIFSWSLYFSSDLNNFFFNKIEPNNMKGVAVFQGKLKGGYCTFIQDSPRSPVKVNGHVQNLPPGKHGFHIHTYGDIRKTDCTKCGGHWNPRNNDHGGLNDENSHAGDLGNIVVRDDGTADFNLKTSKITLYGKESIIGRSIVVHEDPDDLGKGGFPDSLTTGHAGARTDCAVIGYAS